MDINNKDLTEEELENFSEHQKALKVLQFIESLFTQDEAYYQILRGIFLRNKTLRELQSKVVQL